MTIFVHNVLGMCVYVSETFKWLQQRCVDIHQMMRENEDTHNEHTYLHTCRHKLRGAEQEWGEMDMNA